MRIVDLNKLLEIKKRITLRMSIAAGVLIGVPLFLLSLGAGFFTALLFGVLIGGGLFALVFLIRSLTDKGVEKRRAKLGELNGDVIDVMFNREFGLLELFDDMIVFHNLTPGGQEKKHHEISLTNQTFIAAGTIENRTREKLVYKDISRGYVIVRESQNAVPAQFVFINIDGALEHILQIVNTISKYQE